jgi:hypothetical protein
MERVLAAMDIAGPVLALDPMVYRPANRAVLRVRTTQGLLFVKVMRPGKVASLRAVHEAFGEHVPVARCRAWSDPLGLLVLEACPGTPLTRALVDGGPLVPAPALADLVRGLQHVSLPAQGSPATPPVSWHAEVLQAALPAEASRIERLCHASRDRGQGDTPVHGDFYPAQVLVDQDAITGVLDLDSVGLGGTTDDLATCVAHLVALAHVRPAAAAHIDGYRRALLAAASADADPHELNAQVTGVLLGLATAPFRRQESQWQQRTRRWLDLAEACSHGGG